MLQGAPSSPVYFNIYVNVLSVASERTIEQRENRRGAVVLVADDELLQVSTEMKLQELLDVATWWKGERDAL